jgi:biopolymer transport protein ExbD
MGIVKVFVVLVLGFVLVNCVDHEEECKSEIEKIEQLEEKMEIIMIRSTVPVNLPKQPMDNAYRESCVISISSDAYYFGDVKVVMEEISDSLSMFVDNKEKVTIKINADKDASFESVLRIVELCKQNDLKVAFQTSKH